MTLLHICKLNFIFLVDEVELGGWQDPPGPHLVCTEIEVLAAVDSHENDFVTWVFGKTN